MDNPGPAIFETNPEDEFRISLTVPDVREPSGRRPLMTMRCFDADKLRATVVWVGQHQHLWPEWRRIAETKDGNTLSGHLADMVTRDAYKRFGIRGFMLEPCIGAAAEPGRCSDEVVLSMTLATRKLPVISHTFRDARARTAFMHHLMNAGGTGAVELGELGLLRGRNALAAKMDDIARDWAPKLH